MTATGLESLPLISADSHVEEPCSLWSENLPAWMLELLPLELQGGDGSASTFAGRIGVENAPEVAGLTAAAGLTGALDLQELCALTADCDRRFAIMRQDGISGECIYPTAALYVWNIENRDVASACIRVYNDWIYDRLESRSPRFRCAGIIPTWDVDAAVAEVLRIAKMGLAAALIPLVGTPEYNHRQWEPLWSTIEETGMPVVMHQGTGHSMLFYRGPGAAVSNLMASQSMAPRGAAMLATSGVLARHPGLHFVYVETNASWLPWAMNTVDFYQEAFQHYEGWVWPELEQLPSSYMKHQIHGTFQYDPVAIGALARTGAAPLMWGSDFPHAEGTYPRSRALVSEQLRGVDLDAAAAIVGGTAAELFRFDPTVLATLP